jgi:pimeloyl-ACP methyl ester carboxylesterase
MPESDLRGRRVHYERAGQGPLLLLLHGIGGGARSWRPQLADLADELAVVAWDLPVYDAATTADGRPSMADYADDLAALVEHVGGQRSHVLGISMGGVLALEFYRLYPDRVSTLVLADTYCGGGTLPEPERSARLARRLAAAEAPTLAALARARAPELFSAQADAALVQEAEAIMAAIPPAGYRQRATALAHTDLRAVLPRVAVPTLVLWGDQDTVLPLAESEVLRDGIAGADLVVIEGAGHASNQERPTEFNAAVRAFVRAHREAGIA